MIPTAKEFYKAKCNEDRFLSSMNIEDYLIEFAKLHVKAALEAAAENVWSKVDKDSIRNAYPEELIK